MTHADVHSHLEHLPAAQTEHGSLLPREEALEEVPTSGGVGEEEHAKSLPHLLNHGGSPEAKSSVFLSMPGLRSTSPGVELVTVPPKSIQSFQKEEERPHPPPQPMEEEEGEEEEGSPSSPLQDEFLPRSPFHSVQPSILEPPSAQDVHQSGNSLPRPGSRKQGWEDLLESGDWKTLRREFTASIAASEVTDARPPARIAETLAGVAEVKANGSQPQYFLLAILAGIYIGFGGIFYTSVTTVGKHEQHFPYGISQLAGGIVFCVGIILVVIAGSDLFTGNCMVMVIGALSRRITWKQVLQNWTISWVGNLCGGLLLGALVFLSGQQDFAEGHVGLRALQIAQSKCARDWSHTFFLAIHCNVLVCLAVWIATGGRTVTDKVIGMLFPVAAFVAAGFEHAVANMYFIGYALILISDSGYLKKMGISRTEDLPELEWGRFFWNNLLPSSLGNIVGGGIFVAAVYWFVYSWEKQRSRTKRD